MEFNEFKQAFQKNFEKITENVNHLFTVDVDSDELWNLYLDSFPVGTNEIYRERREYDCSACRHFIKHFGNVVIIKNNKVETIWNFQVPDTAYQTVINVLDNFIKLHLPSNVYISKESKIGVDKNLEQLDSGQVVEWQHFYLSLPAKFVYSGRDTIDTVKGNYKAIRDVFKRSLDELSIESVDTVLELINSNTLYKGEEWKGVLETFRKYKVDYDKISKIDEITNFVWSMSIEAGPVVGKIRNHSIGTLLIDITSNMELDEAVKRYEKVVAPTNYKRPKPIFTKQMLADAKKTVEELGYLPSLSRRFATLDDINVNNILFANRDAVKRIVGDDSVFGELQSSISIDPKKFNRVEEISIDKFIKDILPTTTEIEVFFENKLSSNMVSLIVSTKPDAPSMFKWNNAFSWAYIGNITDSTMKENVKMAGGNVEGVLRFSIQWNDGKNHDPNDLDAHCIEPNGNEISFRRKSGHTSSGMLDVDIINPIKSVPAVENITWSDKRRMPKGTYKLFVNQYNNRGGKDGFSAEVEFDGQIFEFNYPHELRQGENVQVAEITFNGENFTIKEKLHSSVSTKEVWNIKTNQFIPLKVIMYSPNYWDQQNGIGHRHVFFMLKDCINDSKPNSFYNEFLKQELIEHHKRVFEALASKLAVEDDNTPDQLSGLGFSTTKRSSIIVKVKGNVERIMKVVI
jgi:hypothetical protein